MTVEIQERPPRNGGRGSTRSKPQLALKKMIPRADWLFMPGEKGPAKGAAESDSTQWDEEQFGAHGADLSQSEFLHRYSELQREIELMLNYPGILGRHGIEGTVNARLKFTEDSHCDLKKIRISGAQPYLRVYIFTLLNKLCGLSVVERSHFKKGHVVDFSFKFTLLEMPQTREEEESRSRITGNVLSFERGFLKSSVEWQLGPIRGVWFAPFVSLDTDWIFEKWEKYVDKKDPFRDFR